MTVGLLLAWCVWWENLQQDQAPAVKEEIVESAVLVSKEIQPESSCVLIDNFSDNSGWQVVNDGVMWGLSRGNYLIEDEQLVFSGVINTDGGWFSSIRLPLWWADYSGFTHIKIIGNSDNRWYDFTLRDTNWRQRNISHRHQLDLVDWEGLIDLSELGTTFFGRVVSASPLNTSSISEIGIILNDGLDGDFKIELDEIWGCG